jgi:DNA-binding NarL/FixJ family response regulator
VTKDAQLAEQITLELQMEATVHVAGDLAAALRTLHGVRGFSGFIIHEPLMKHAAAFAEQVRKVHPEAALVVLSPSGQKAVVARAQKLGAELLREPVDRRSLHDALKLSL